MGIIHQRRKAETRALLVAAGLQLFSEQGFELVTLDEVALAAGFTCCDHSRAYGPPDRSES